MHHGVVNVGLQKELRYILGCDGIISIIKAITITSSISRIALGQYTLGMAVSLRNRIQPNQREGKLAQNSSHFLAKHGKKALKVKLEGREETVTLPASAVQILTQALEEIAQGNGVILLTPDTELSTHEAAEWLNVSRPYLIKVLKKGDLPYYKVGSHRRIKLEDLFLYKQRSDKERRKALRELVVEAQKLKMGY